VPGTEPTDSPRLPVTAYALLGLLTFGDPVVTGYELKQRADITMRFYWTSPAMSQIYTELARLAEHGLVVAVGEGRSTRYKISARGRLALRVWMHEEPAGFPIWKHPVALRLINGHVTSPAALTDMLRDYLVEVAAARADLADVRRMLTSADGPGEDYRYPSLVADWGLAHFDSEREITERLIEKLAEEAD
jgi:DNA-binding PadR family transcriptional regulator